MNNVNMANMNPMGGGPVGAPMSMMGNGAGAGPAGPRQQSSSDQRTLLNTYIYEYFLRNDMYDCARAMINSDPPININVNKDSPNRRRGENGLGGDRDSMDTDSKEDLDSKRPDDLPAPNVPTPPESCFLYEWFAMFWDVFHAQRGKGNNAVLQYVNHTQTQSRLRQNQQQEMLRNMRPDPSIQQQQFMMRGMPNGPMNMNMKQQQANLARTAMANNQNPQMQMLQQRQNQMQRDPSDAQRPSSPSSTDNAPSPSKKPRLDGAAPFNAPPGAGIMPNGRPPQGMPGPQVAPSAPAQMLLTNGINPNQLTPGQFQQFASQPAAVQAKSIAAYSQNMAAQHMTQMPNKVPGPGGPPGQGSPMMGQGPENPAALNAYYNAGEMGPGGIRPGPVGQAGGGSNHALQDYQMQLMLLEQQNKKRLMMARQEQDSGIGPGMATRPDGSAGPGAPGAPGPNGQQFQDTSPQGGRTGASPNPSDQMKRGTPQMNNAGVPSPLPEGAQSRGSPNPMNFMGAQMDPNLPPNFFKGGNGMEGGMVGPGQMGPGMRPPPSSHPGQFNGQMGAQPMMAGGRPPQQGANGQAGQQWQGPNGGPMAGQGPQGQVQGAPQQQRPMPPPSAPATASSKTATASPQPSNAAPPTPQPANKTAIKKKDNKNAKDKRAATQKKSNSNLNTAAAAAEAAPEAEPPTPATPITPVNVASFNKNAQNAAAAPPVPNGQTSAAPPAAAPVAQQAPHADSLPNGSFGMEPGSMDFGNMDFANPLTSNDVLDSFDFDSFLHDGEGDPGFDFNASTFNMEGAGEIGAD